MVLVTYVVFLQVDVGNVCGSCAATNIRSVVFHTKDKYKYTPMDKTQQNI